MSYTERARMFGTRHGVVTGHHLATQSAFRVLTAGGSLVDAMVCASAVMTVALPHATSLGGCGMMLYYDAGSRRLQALNGTGRAPGLADPSRFEGAIGPRGPETWVVPGLVGLWEEAHRRFGKLPWTSLFDDAIRVAADGMGFSSEIARNLRLAKGEVTRQPGFAELFHAGNRPLEAGERLTQAALAHTLEGIAEGGSREFYQGDIARRLDAYARETGGLLRADDLASHRTDWVDPVTHALRGLDIAVMPPNSLGVLMLAQLDGLSPYLDGDADARSHAQIQIARLCLELYQTRVADAAAAWPVTLDAALVASRLALPAHTIAHAEFHDPGDTAGIVLADARDNALVMLQSVFQPFGSGCVDPSTGILLNNRLIEFDLDPASPNRLAPHKRPTHTLNPYMVFKDGAPYLLAVSPGGVSQTTTGVQVICNSCFDGAALTRAVDAPRWSISRDGGILLEAGFSEDVAERLRRQGVAVETGSRHPFYFGSAKAIRIETGGVLEVAADPRRQAYGMCE